MTTTEHEIQVFAMFPTNPEWTTWDWVHCLTFQPDILIRCNLSLKPYKWIRYAIGVVVGAQGHLSFKPDNPEDVINYDDDLRLESAVLYYHTTQDERQRMFPADPDMDRTSLTSSNATTQRANFSNGIVARDGVCLLTGYSVHVCKAAHLLPHSKGNSYIDTYTRCRSQNAVSNIVHEINSVRNGVLLNRIAHMAIGKHIAFLVTPNFAMSSTDIDPTFQPAEKRHTAHLFEPDSSEFFGEPAIRSGFAVRVRGAADQQPPDILFDLVYASAILYNFAPQSMRDALERWKSTFYSRAARSSHQATADRQAAAKIQKKNEQNRARNERAARRANNRGDYFDYLTILPHILIPPDKLEDFLGKAAEERAERERSCLEDKVGGWAREVADACR